VSDSPLGLPLWNLLFPLLVSSTLLPPAPHINSRPPLKPVLVICLSCAQWCIFFNPCLRHSAPSVVWTNSLFSPPLSFNSCLNTSLRSSVFDQPLGHDQHLSASEAAPQIRPRVGCLLLLPPFPSRNLLKQALNSWSPTESPVIINPNRFSLHALLSPRFFFLYVMVVAQFFCFSSINQAGIVFHDFFRQRNPLPFCPPSGHPMFRPPPLKSSPPYGVSVCFYFALPPSKFLFFRVFSGCFEPPFFPSPNLQCCGDPLFRSFIRL